MSRLDALVASVAPLRERLVSHRLYPAIDSIESLRIFMEHHVYAVWDFMTLLKSLQRRLTCVEIPWVPRGDGLGRHLVNAIVLAEESDDDGRGGFASHFETYLDAMRQAGADASRVADFLGLLGRGRAIDEALAGSGAPAPAIPFVATTWRIARGTSSPAIAAAFTLGREDLIPDLFRGLIARSPESLATFRHYLDRHVELDGDEHGPMALRLVATLCGDDPIAWRDAEAAAREALEARLALWDGIADRIEAGRPEQSA